jgi:hypothetical protein
LNQDTAATKKMTEWNTAITAYQKFPQFEIRKSDGLLYKVSTPLMRTHCLRQETMKEEGVVATIFLIKEQMPSAAEFKCQRTNGSHIVNNMAAKIMKPICWLKTAKKMSQSGAAKNTIGALTLTTIAICDPFG